MITVVNAKITGRGRNKPWGRTPRNQVKVEICSVIPSCNVRINIIFSLCWRKIFQNEICSVIPPCNVRTFQVQIEICTVQANVREIYPPHMVLIHQIGIFSLWMNLLMIEATQRTIKMWRARMTDHKLRKRKIAFTFYSQNRERRAKC